MIVTSEHAREALEVLTGKRIPSIMDMDDRVYEFYKGFLEPLLKSQGVVFGLVNALDMDWELNPHRGDADDTREANGGSLPSHTWPEGEPIVYTIEGETGMSVLCHTCAVRAENLGAILHEYRVGAAKCTDCKDTPRSLDELYE